MERTRLPLPPPAIADDVSASQKFNELCAVLLERGLYQAGKENAVEVAALSYSRWRAAEDLLDVIGVGVDTPTKIFSAAHRYRDAYFKALIGLGLIRPSEVSAPPATAGRPKPISIKPQTSPPKIKIFG